MEWDVIPHWFEVMILNSIIWAGDKAAPVNVPRYEKQEIAGGITLCVVRGKAAVAAHWLFAFACFQRLGFSLAELWLAVGAGEDDAHRAGWERRER